MIYIILLKIYIAGYVHLDIVNPETGFGTGQDGEISEKLEFMSSIPESRAEPAPQASHHNKHGKVERATYSKVKHAVGQKEDASKVENNTAQDNPAQDDIGKN